MTTLRRNDGSAGERPAHGRRVLLVGLIVAAGALLFVFANLHLVYVAVTSQPECVTHLKTSGEASGSFRAAKSAC